MTNYRRQLRLLDPVQPGLRELPRDRPMGPLERWVIISLLAVLMLSALMWFLA